MDDGVVFLVEDNPDDAMLTVRAFAECGFPQRIRVLTDGASCLSALATAEESAQDGGPALVLLDVKLPIMGGCEVLRRIRADDRTRTLPVVMLSTSREEPDIIESFRSGANSFVRKPLSFAKLVATMRVLGTYWLEINEPCPPRQR